MENSRFNFNWDSISVPIFYRSDETSASLFFSRPLCAYILLTKGIQTNVQLELLTILQWGHILTLCPIRAFFIESIQLWPWFQFQTQGYDVASVSWTVASNFIPSRIAYQVHWENSLGKWPTMTAPIRPFKTVLPATTKYYNSH